MACDIMSTSALETGIQYPSMIKEIAKPSSLNVLTMNSSNNGQTKELKLSTKATPVLQEAVKNENLKLTQKDANPLGNIAPVPTPTASFKEPPKSSFSFPKSIKENSKDTLLAETSSAPTIKTNSALKVKDDSAAILITQFNKAYNDFQLDFSKLVNFSSDLSGLALSNKESSTENVSSESQELSMKIGLIQDSLFEVETKFEELKSQLLHTWSKKEESDRRLRTLKTKDHEKDSNSTNSLGQALGPEAEELKKLLNIKKKVKRT
jgi:Txe/YoeB family toxin of Txe-Axe toxin-antitoxin module